MSLVLALAVVAWLLGGSLPAQAIAGATATRVYGQAGSFTFGTANNGGISAVSLNVPYGVALDGSGGVYVADRYNHRVLHYSGSSTTADRVYGQLGSFTSNTANNGGISAASLSFPAGITPDGGGGLYVADNNNQRVLHYSGTSTTADRVYGQGGSFTSRTQNNGGISAASLYNPFGVALDPSGGLYVSDVGNSRVLHYSGSSTTADRVYGQNGSFTSGDPNTGGVSATTLYGPFGLGVDGSGGLYIADARNNRVLHYSGTSTTADRVYGQNGSFTSFAQNVGGVSAATLYDPFEVVIDRSGGLYVADQANNRVLHYSGSSTTADRVYGQGGSFNSGTANNGGISAASLSAPYGLAPDGSGGLYVGDSGNNRVLYYPPSVPALVSILVGSGQSTTVATTFSTRLVAKVVDGSSNPVSSVVVTFTAPSSGASGTFTGGSHVYTGTTDASGLVTATTFTANTLAGSYSVTASVSGVSTPATFALTNTAGLGDNMGIIGGNNQSATVNTAFSNPLVVSVTDQYNNPVSGKVVTFTAPNSGASATFAGGATTLTATTGVTGQATSPLLTANSTSGTYTVSASTSGRNGSLSANFTLTNTAGAASGLVLVSGDNQQTAILTAFSSPLVVKVTDASNNPVSGVKVVFTAPTSGASAGFAGSPVYTGTTDAAGLVTSTLPSANSTAGNYSVSAAIIPGTFPARAPGGGLSPRVTSVQYHLTNLVGPAATISGVSGSGQSAVVSTTFASPLTARVTDVGNNPVSSVVVTFTAPGSGASGTFGGGSTIYTGTTDVSGVVTTTAFTANSLAGTYSVTATVGGVNTPATFTLTNVAACNPLMVTSTLDDGSCGTLRQALTFASTSSNKAVVVNLSAGSVITLTSGLTLTSGVSITTTTSCGVGAGNTMLPPVTIQGAGSSSGNGLTLSGSNQLYGLWVRGFSEVQIHSPAGSHTKMQCVKASKA